MKKKIQLLYVETPNLAFVSPLPLLQCDVVV